MKKKPIDDKKENKRPFFYSQFYDASDIEAASKNAYKVRISLARSIPISITEKGIANAVQPNPVIPSKKCETITVTPNKRTK